MTRNTATSEVAESMAQSPANLTTPVYLEVGSKRVFACALDWPGWCRSGKNEEAALETLAATAPRYAVVAKEAHIPFPQITVASFAVVQRMPGSATTDFGALDKPTDRDNDPLTEAAAKRQADLVGAAWTILDRVVASAPASLRKGPRGGGRDRDKVFEHVVQAEASYARKLGVRHPVPSASDTPAINALRDAILEALRSASGPPLVERGWLPRYAARRIAWHVLDHAWEIEDRSESAPAALS